MDGMIICMFLMVCIVYAATMSAVNLLSTRENENYQKIEMMQKIIDTQRKNMENLEMEFAKQKHAMQTFYNVTAHFEKETELTLRSHALQLTDNLNRIEELEEDFDVSLYELEDRMEYAIDNFQTSKKHLDDKLEERERLLYSIESDLLHTLKEVTKKVDHSHKSTEILLEKYDSSFDEFKECIDERVDKVNERFDEFEERVDEHFEKVEESIEKVEESIEKVEENITEKMDTLEERLAKVEDSVADIEKEFAELDNEEY